MLWSEIYYQSATTNYRNASLFPSALWMHFEIVGEFYRVEVIARGRAVRERTRLNRHYGNGDWRKMKGFCQIKVGNQIGNAEIHWYEANGIGRRELKIKRFFWPQR